MRRKTLRKFPPHTRQLFKLITEADSALRRLKNLGYKIMEMEQDHLFDQVEIAHAPEENPNE